MYGRVSVMGGSQTETDNIIFLKIIFQIKQDVTFEMSICK